ncbi:conserved protein of unknown function [Tenacibaculum sp. 190524A02b]|uniref:DUF3696 domain-containing protein n=1 Tax=Tenacibaculum vairaonense TaxID=3137860 RepID=UPI0032B1C226
MKLRVENYKSIISDSFDFSQINILIGENSAGKSSIIKLFLLLKQGMMGYKNRTSFNLALKGEYFDFGNFKDLISFNKVDEKIVFEFEFDNYHEFYVEFINDFFENYIIQYDQEVKDFINFTIDNVVKLKFEFDSNIKHHSGVVTTIYNEYIGEITLESFVNENVTFKTDSCNLLFNEKGKVTEYSSIEFEKESFYKYLKSDSLLEVIKKQESNLNDKEIFIKFLPISFLLISQNYLEVILDRITYINPIHSSPKRYFIIDDPNTIRDDSLESMVNLLNDEEIITPETKVQLLKRLNDAINFLGIANEIKLEEASNNIPVVEVKAKIRNFWSNIMDVGYGLSLQLPIIFKIIMNGIIGRGNLIIIEQPEVHLHPQLQAKFIETIIKYGGECRFIIETHSEHIIRKLQLLVKNKEYGLTHKDVSIHYFKRKEEGSQISNHKILEDGRLSKNLPSGFFDSSYLLAKELL